MAMWRGLVKTVSWLMLLLYCVEACQFGPSSEGCTYPCHCVYGMPCDQDTGTCTIGCNPGPGQDVIASWSGPGCQVGNVAYETSATIGPSMLDAASNAIDGMISSCAVSYSFSSTPVNLEVDLGDTYYMQSINIYANDGILQGSVVEVWYQGSYRLCTVLSQENMVSVGSQTMFTLNCNSPMQGQKLRVTGTATMSYLAICEVVIQGFLFRSCPAGRHGQGCLLDCLCDDIQLPMTANCPETTETCPYTVPPTTTTTTTTTTTRPTTTTPTTTPPTTPTTTPPTTTPSTTTPSPITTQPPPPTTVPPPPPPTTPAPPPPFTTPAPPTTIPFTTPSTVSSPGTTKTPGYTTTPIPPDHSNFTPQGDTEGRSTESNIAVEPVSESMEMMTVVYAVVSSIFGILVIVCIAVIVVLCRGMDQQGYEEYQPSLDDTSIAPSSTVFDMVREPPGSSINHRLYGHHNNADFPQTI